MKIHTGLLLVREFFFGVFWWEMVKKQSKKKTDTTEPKALCLAVCQFVF